MAERVSACAPPSEKESGVTLTIPMTFGRFKAMRNREVCQNMVCKKNGALSPVIVPVNEREKV
jgi:hypothetical protein